MRKGIRGTGLTRTEYWTWSIGDPVDELARMTEELAPDGVIKGTWSTVREWIDELTSLMDRRGLPANPGSSVITGRDWEWRYPGASRGSAEPGDGERLLGYVGYFEERFGHDSPEWYMAGAIRIADILDRAEQKAQVAEFALRLGIRLTDMKWKFCHEDAAMEGYRGREGRRRGQPAATAQRRRDGARRSAEIVRAARELWQQEPDLSRNDSATARRIEKMGLRALAQANGRPIGAEAIRKHLARARRAGKLGKS